MFAVSFIKKGLFFVSLCLVFAEGLLSQTLQQKVKCDFLILPYILAVN